jgi:phage gp29-like protein
MVKLQPEKKPSSKVEIPYQQATGAVYVEHNAWETTTLWTPGDIKSALDEADAGLLQAAADVCDAQWRDDRIRGTLQTRVGALLGLNNSEKLEFETQNDAIREAIREDWWISAPESELSRLVRWGIHLGVGIAQRKVVRNNGRWVPRLKTWHPRNLSYDFVRETWEIDTKDGRIEIRPDDPHWVLFTPYGESRPWADGTWLPSGLLWLIKLYGSRSWAKHNDTHGSGGLKGKAPESSTEQARQAFWRDLKNFGRNARIVLPEGYDIEMLEAMGQTWQTFQESLRYADTGIAIVHLGQPMTTEVPKGAQTGADNARAVRQDYMEFDAENLATWAHDKHLPAWTIWNYVGATEADIPWPRYNATPPINLQIEAGTLAALGSAIDKLIAVAPTGKTVDTEALFYRYNIPLRKQTRAELAALTTAENDTQKDNNDAS